MILDYAHDRYEVSVGAHEDSFVIVVCLGPKWVGTASYDGIGDTWSFITAETTTFYDNEYVFNSSIRDLARAVVDQYIYETNGTILFEFDNHTYYIDEQMKLYDWSGIYLGKMVINHAHAAAYVKIPMFVDGTQVRYEDVAYQDLKTIGALIAIHAGD
jgi:hypothetical protein